MRHRAPSRISLEILAMPHGHRLTNVGRRTGEPVSQWNWRLNHAAGWRPALTRSILYYMGTITLRVPDDMDRALQRQSTALGISKSDLAREALKRYLRVTEFRSLRTKLVARAQASGINTDDDVFEVLKKK
jgi:predicted transcriptional regulator